MLAEQRKPRQVPVHLRDRQRLPVLSFQHRRQPIDILTDVLHVAPGMPDIVPGNPAHGFGFFVATNPVAPLPRALRIV